MDGVVRSDSSACLNVNRDCRGELTEPSVLKMLKWSFSFPSGPLPQAPDPPPQA
jgi:hypothetical protein